MPVLLIVVIVGILAAIALTANELGADSRDVPGDTHTNFPAGAH